MIEDVHEPLELYTTKFKEAHKTNTAEFFEKLVKESNVDEGINAATVSELRQAEHKIEKMTATHSWQKILLGLILIGYVCSALYIYNNHSLWWLILLSLVSIPLSLKIWGEIKKISNQLASLQTICDQKKAQAWGQMAALNELYDWDIVEKLLSKTIPRIFVDPYFSNGRMSELCKTFGWDGHIKNDRSIIFAYSGAINGNPFVLGQSNEHWIDSKTYHGSLQITWTEQVKDSKGNWTTVTKRQTLHASVDKPHPEYGNRTFFIYGNEAAPDLSFSRNPSDLSGLEDGILNNWKKRRAVKKLEERSRDLTSSKGFTVMANREFDALFGATDRNHEVQFRLLFTPLAQQEMLKLLQDTNVGYGDDFEFVKSCMINIIEPKHMRATDIDANPHRFHSYELAQARKLFNEYHNDFFRSFYFGIAPLLAIPLYQQNRPHADIYKDTYSQKSCFWEHESIANYYGEKEFQHPDCITKNILKTESFLEDDGVQKVHVTAWGYKGIDRITFVPVSGGDGHTHQVPVKWIEYIGVNKTSGLLVGEDLSVFSRQEQTIKNDNAPIAHKAQFEQLGVNFSNSIIRRSIHSALLHA